MSASAELASPCINVCRMHAATGWCEGCARSLDEIAAWSRADEASKRAILARLPERQACLRALGVTFSTGKEAQE